MRKIFKFIARISLMALIGIFGILSISNVTVKAYTSEKVYSLVKDVTDLVGIDISKYFDTNVINRLPDELKDDDIISVIIELNDDPLYDIYSANRRLVSFSEFVNTKEAKESLDSINSNINKKIERLNKNGLDYELGETYSVLVSGFEVSIKAKDFKQLKEILPTAKLVLGETYEKCETQVVTNDVDVYETGIFDSSMLEYQGDGVVIAVLDTGLDYTHTAFSVDNFTTTNAAFTLASVSAVVGQTKASQFTSGLTGEDVYLNEKVPYAYDYADKDADVAPINSEHGTHVAGIIAGKDDTITGVAPNAQLAIFKVFSDHQEGAKSSWLIAALEDCVTLGVDVINMSLGSPCGFTREVDKEAVRDIYQKVYDSGIELIASAANQYTATQGSSKNGNNALTRNPDFGTVGAPSTYEAALSIASVNGEMTSYLKVKDTIVYFNEAFTNSADDTKSFVDDILKTVGDNVDSHDFEYVVIPGLGRSSDYPEDDSYYEGKIVLVKRGQTTFEDKVRVALKEKGAAGIIIYNNVSGTISMSVGANIGAVCSISQDDGEFLVSMIDKETGIGKISISRGNVAGPFMSDFSSWGPTSDLRIKPEITAHGGNILSAVPGQAYEKLSGTSMAAPNLTGAAALIIQYVKYSGIFGSNLSTGEVTKIVNQLMMSTSDIIYDKNGLPSSVRKQGSGLISISKSTTAESYISTYDKLGNKMDKAKLELGDDKAKTGVYTMTVDVNNISNKVASYNVNSIVLTEGVSTTYTSHGDTTVTQNEYMLDGAKISVKNISGGSANGNAISVNAKSTAKVTLEITLSDGDKKYLNDSFENGMYVEGYVLFDGFDGTLVNLNVPFLAFYGDWTQAPIFDEEYYDTHKDEINKGLDDEDKLMADTTPTRVIGGLYTDYIATLGTYYFVQNPANTQIAASKEHIAVSNQNKGESGSTISSIRSVSAGMLRNAKEIYISIVEDSTGKEIYTDMVSNQRKSYSSGSTIYGSSIEIDYAILAHELKNNTSYTCTLTAYIDYGTKEEQKNVRNTFSFPFYVDFEAPIVTGVNYRTEYDKTTKKTKLFADLSVYDNHYAMGLQLGQITQAPEGSEYTFSMNSFGKYMTPVYSSYNSTSIVSIELTDYVSQLKNSCGILYDSEGNFSIDYNNNSFIVSVYDYAMNTATYQIELPDEIAYMCFNEEKMNISPNETVNLGEVLSIYPTSSWIEVLDFESSDTDVVSIVNNTLIGKKSGVATITASGYDKDGNSISASMEIKVLAEGEEGYVGNYSIPEINKFTLDGYKTLRAYYFTSNEDREIGVDNGEYDFGDAVTLSMYPSEKVELKYTLDSYFPESTSVTFKVSNGRIASIDENGVLTALAKGNTTVMVSVLFNGKATLYSAKISLTVKDPYKINSIYLMGYYGLGGEVVIPSDRGITTIYNYAFSNYKYIDKDLENGDVIDEEDPYYIKQTYIGDETITKIVLPEGVTTIDAYAFANLTALEEVVFPSTLTRIGVGAFYNCTSLKKINLDNVKFINEKAFYNCPINEVTFKDLVSIGTFAFENCKNLNYIVLPECAQSLADGAFYNCSALASVTLKASKIKLGNYAFAKCSSLQSININSTVISSYAFEDCKELSDVTLGQDVSVIGEYAFIGTNVSAFKLSPKNKILKLENDGALILKGDELLLAAPNYVGEGNTIVTSAKTIQTGSFAGNKKVFYVDAPNATVINDFAFAQCVNLLSINMPKVQSIGKYAFAYSNLSDLGTLADLKEIGDYAFAFNFALESLTLTDDVNIGRYAFAYCTGLKSVTVGNNVNVGEYAFFCPVNAYTYENTNNFNYYKVYTYELKDDNNNVIGTNYYYAYDFASGAFSSLKTFTAGSNLTTGEGAFFGNASLRSVDLGENANIGAYSFYSCVALDTLDFTKVKTIGDYAFAGYRTQDYWLKDNTWYLAFEQQYDDGVFTNTALKYSCFAPCFVSVDLSNVSEMGTGVFMGNTSLVSVTLSDNLDSVKEYAFANCSKLESITLKENVTSIGDYAFYGSGLKNINLENIDEIGKCAFYHTSVNDVTFKDGVKINDQAFYYDRSLKNVMNSENISYIGAYAFTLTNLETIDLANVTYIGDFAFSQSKLLNVSLGDKLTDLGENPFYGCDITSFGKKGSVTVGKNQYETIEETYDLNENVKVIDGVLYQVIPTGLELVSYPKLKQNTDYTVVEGTTRISAAAFAYAELESVTLSNVLRSIGDKAFFGCENLRVVVFTSYDAPKLEETYNPQYAGNETLPITGNMGTYTGLGISKYYMWNLSSNLTNFYYGATFKDYIGQNTGDLVISKPVNGQNYDSFIFNQYFKTFVNGASAPTLETIKVINAINNIPSNITLNSESVIVLAREAYNNMTSIEQQALVTNYTNLVKAEATLQYLKNRDNPPVIDPIVDPEPIKKGCNSKDALVVALLSCSLGFLGFAVLKKREEGNE